MKYKKEIQLTVKDLTKRINGEIVLDQVSFVIKKGDFVGLIGPNGAGKSTLLKVILGLESYTMGQCVVEPHVRMSYVPQQYVLPDHVPISVCEVVMMGVSTGHVFYSKKQIAQVGDVLKKVGISENMMHDDFHTLSGGQKQRVIIARALVTSPDLLLCDEPFSGVDHMSKRVIYDLLTDINKNDGVSIVFVSHDVESVIEHTTRVLCLNKRLYHGCHPVDFARSINTCDMPKNDNICRAVHHHHSK